MPTTDLDWPHGESKTVLNEAGWKRAMRACGVYSEKDLAELLRISEPALWRVRKGHAQPGTKFIRHSVRGLKASYQELFRHEDQA